MKARVVRTQTEGVNPHLHDTLGLFKISNNVAEVEESSHTSDAERRERC